MLAAADALDAAEASGPDDARRGVGAAGARAQVVVSELAPRSANRLFDAGGASATARDATSTAIGATPVRSPRTTRRCTRRSDRRPAGQRRAAAGQRLLLGMAIATVSPCALRAAMGAFPTGVTVVTTVGRGGEPVGTTANAVTSLSLEPPLLLVCFGRESRTLAAIREHGGFAVNVLGTRHRDVSAAFARSGAADAWAGLEHRAGPSGSPCLADALAHLDCTLQHRMPGGDHEILVGRVLHAEAGADDDPLIFHRGRYASLAPAGPGTPAEPAEAAESTDAAESAESIDAVGSAGAAGVVARLPTPLGDLRIAAGDGGLVALVHGDPAAAPRAVVRFHRACLLGRHAALARL